MSISVSLLRPTAERGGGGGEGAFTRSLTKPG